MRYNPEKHHRQSVRLEGYDYSRVGLYFVTVCCWQKECLFGRVVSDTVELTEAGSLAERFWKEIPVRFPSVVLDEFVIMPNHLHGILQFTMRDNEKTTLGSVMRAYKSLSAIAINRQLGRSERPVWQRNYHEHLVGDEEALSNIRRYIILNPSRWDKDDENPDNAPSAVL